MGRVLIHKNLIILLLLLLLQNGQICHRVGQSSQPNNVFGSHIDGTLANEFARVPLLIWLQLMSNNNTS